MTYAKYKLLKVSVHQWAVKNFKYNNWADSLDGLQSSLAAILPITAKIKSKNTKSEKCYFSCSPGLWSWVVDALPELSYVTVTAAEDEWANLQMPDLPK